MKMNPIIIKECKKYPLDTASLLAFISVETGDHDTDFLIAPKELDAYIGGQTYASEDPSIVLDCSDTDSDTLFYVTSR